MDEARRISITKSYKLVVMVAEMDFIPTACLIDSVYVADSFLSNM
jgi:hypothetical protein